MDQCANVTRNSSQGAAVDKCVRKESGVQAIGEHVEVIVIKGRAPGQFQTNGAKFGVVDDISLNFTLFFNLEEFWNSNGLCVCVYVVCVECILSLCVVFTCIVFIQRVCVECVCVECMASICAQNVCSHICSVCCVVVVCNVYMQHVYRVCMYVCSLCVCAS